MTPKTLVDCGCAARVYGDGSGIEIAYCPVHRQAPAMLEALRDLLNNIKGEPLNWSRKRYYVEQSIDATVVDKARAILRAIEEG